MNGNTTTYYDAYWLIIKFLTLALNCEVECNDFIDSRKLFHIILLLDVLTRFRQRLFETFKMFKVLI